MSTQIESKLSATLELTHWAGSILTAMAWNTIESNPLFLVATSLACLLGSFLYYNKSLSRVSSVKETVTSSTPEIASVETTKIDSAVITTAKMVEAVDNDSFPCINLVPTDDTESYSDISEEEDREDWHEADYNQTFCAHTNNVVSDSDDNSIDNHDTEEESDADDWNESDYNQRFPTSKPATRRTASKKESVSQPTTATRETRAQMRKRVARQMKEAELRKKNQAASKAVHSAVPTKKSVRKETVAEMKARVAREFAAKLKQ